MKDKKYCTHVGQYVYFLNKIGDKDNKFMVKLDHNKIQ